MAFLDCYTLMPKGPDQIKMIYGTNKANPQSWYFQGVQDQRMKIYLQGGVAAGGAGGSLFSQNVDGSYSLSQNNQVYLAIETNDKSGTIGLNQQQSSARGFMRNIRDWTNIESHFYAYVDPANTIDGSFTVSCHGGNPYSTLQNICVGVGYSFTVFKSGICRFGKALSYPSGFLYTDFKNLLTDLAGRWIGIKFVCIVLGPGKVKLEAYVDEGNLTNNWILIDSIVDSGGWGGRGLSLDPEEAAPNACGGTTDQVLDMGGPIVSFAWRDFDSLVNVKNFGIREINPKASYTDPGVQEGSGEGSLHPRFGVQPERDSQFYPDSENFATEDREGT